MKPECKIHEVHVPSPFPQCLFLITLERTQCLETVLHLSLFPLASPQAKALNVYGAPSSGGRSPYSSCCSCLVGSNPETLCWNAGCILSIATDMNDLTEPGLNAPIINCLVISCFSDFADKFLQQITLGTV